MSDRFKGRVKPEVDKFATLKAWVHWAMKNPIDDDQLAHAKATNDLFALLGTREAEIATLVGENQEITVMLAEMENLKDRFQIALEKIADPRKRDHIEPDAYTNLCCVMSIADEALSPPAEKKSERCPHDVIRPEECWQCTPPAEPIERGE